MVGGREKLVKVTPGGFEGGHADGDGHPHRSVATALVADRGGDLRDFLAESFGDLEGFCRVGAREQDRELLPPEPAGDIAVAQETVQGTGDAGQHGIAGQVAVGVVHVLEVVDVGDGDGERRAALDRAHGFQAGFPLPGGGIEQAGLAVDTGGVDQLGVPEGTVQQRDQRQGDQRHERAGGDRVGDHDADGQLGGVVEQRLTGEQFRAYAGGRVSALDRGHHQDLVDCRLEDGAGRRRPGPGEHPGLRARRKPGDQRRGRMEGQRRCAVGKAHGGGGENAPVNEGRANAPLHQSHPGDGHQERVEGRQQECQRQFPHRMHVLDQPCGLARAVGQLHGRQVAGEQDSAQLQVSTAEVRCRSRDTDGDQVCGRHGHDESQ